MKVSVIITTRNESRHIGALLESLVQQEHLHEVILVDAQSSDDTVNVARSFAQRLPLHVLVEPCTRGQGRNLGAANATGDVLAFIDGDCVAKPGWLTALARHPDVVVAGQTDFQGPKKFTAMTRVAVLHGGQDVTWPSCNLAYPRPLFEKLGGFDARFITAEDIDLNLRAVDAGARIVHEPEAIVLAKTRSTRKAFLRQAFWNGYGRRQLQDKHGNLWGSYPKRTVARQQLTSFWGAARLGAGFLGYLRAKVRGPRED